MGKRSREMKKRRDTRSQSESATDDESSSAATETAATEPETPQPVWLLVAECLALVAIVVLPYVSSLSNGFVYDDVVLILAKPAPSSLSAALSVFTEAHHPSGLHYYRPLSALTISVQKAIWGNAPLPYHVFNVATLAICALVLRGLFRSLLGTGTSRRLLATAFAALFVMHPVVSSTVHAISGRDTLFVVLFMTAALWAFLRAGRASFVASHVLLGAALLCKEQAVALPLIFVLADWLRMSADSPRRTAEGQDWTLHAWEWTRRYAFIALLVVGYLAVRSEVLADVTAGGTKAIELALFTEPLRPLLSLLYSLQTIFAPMADLQYEPHLAAWLSPLRALFAVACVAGLGSVAMQRGAAIKPALLFFAGWGIATLLPSANIVAQETHFAERYVVLPYLGVVGVVAVLSGELFARQPLRSLITAALVLALVAMGLLSHNRGQFFENDHRFLLQWAKSDPTSYQSRSSLGEYYRNRKQFAAAVPYEREALRLLHEALPEPLCIKRHFAFAEALTGNAQYEEAAAQYVEILRMRPSFSGARRLHGRVSEQAELARQPRGWGGGGLGDANRERLLQGLSAETFEGRPVWLTSTRADSRSLQMMSEVEDVFLQAGWNVEASESVEFSLKPGVFIFVAEDVAPDYVTSLQPLLATAGLPVTTLATGYRAYAEEKSRENPGWTGIQLAPDQAYVIVIGRPTQ